MTGFGKASGTCGSKTVTVEIKSLNSKSCDLSVRLPGAFKEKDIELRSALTKDLERGKIDFLMYFENSEVLKRHTINQALATAYYQELKQLGDALQQPDIDYMSMILKMPDIMETDHQPMEESEWLAAKSIIDTAVADFNKFRSDEGRVLYNELKARVDSILRHLEEIEGMDAFRIEHVKTRLNKGISEFIENDKIDRNRFEQELIYYIEKIDITEEKVRLKTHCDYFIANMNESANNGKKLGFITQEIGREINTIGSKANDAGVQKIVVQMKDELEKIKEQSLNIL